jgi:hypothetical protein
MNQVGLVKKNADGEIVRNDRGAVLPKFTFHALRHWFAAHALVATGGNYELVKKWGGWSLTSTLVNNYSYVLDDPDAREKFEQMPSWLAPPLELTSDGRPIVDGRALSAAGATIALPAPAPECPIEVPDFAERWLKVFVHELWRSGGNMRHALAPTGKTGTQIRYELRRCQLPTVDELRALFSATGEVEVEPVPAAAPTTTCPIDLPDGAADWLAPYIRALDSGVLHQVACRMVHKDPPVVRAELRRLKLPEPRELGRRLRQKRMLALIAAGHGDMDVAARLGLKDRHTVQHFRRDLLKPSESKSLKSKDNSAVSPRRGVALKHEKQGKLL